jgi:anti-anti-sigma regulatory factor
LADPKEDVLTDTDLQYSISEKNHMLVVTLTGDLSTASLAQLDSCRKEILGKKEVRCVVLYFQKVEQVTTDVIPFVTQLQRDIRTKPSELRLCGLKSSIRERLLKTGVIRGLEIAEDLKSALLSFSTKAN